MKFEDLNNFQVIFKRDDYSYISAKNNITRISKILLYYLSNPEGSEQQSKNLLIQYLKNLTSFFSWLEGRNIPDLEEGCKRVDFELKRALNLFNEDEEKRIAVSKAYCKKFNKQFLYGLIKIDRGVKLAFDPELISSTKIEGEQIVRYILNKDIGLGRKCLFNIAGPHSFANKIDLLNRRELISTLGLLIRPSLAEIRTYNKWRDLGAGSRPVRILLSKKILRKDKVYFLYKVNEHTAYQDQLQVPPENVPFREGA